MPMKFVKRSSFGWGPANAGYAPCRNGLVIHYNGGNTGLYKKPHSSCVSYWKNTRSFHINGNGWNDIGYSFGVCPHGYVFEGRGWQKNQAAQPGGNTTWTSCTLMSGPSENPTDAQIQGVRELRKWLMGKGLKSAIKGHRDFFATACPGNKLYALVKNGTFAKAPGKTTPPKDIEDMPKHLDTSGTADLKLTAGKWKYLTFKSADGKHWPSVLDGSKGGAYYSADVSIRLIAPEGAECQVRIVETDAKDNVVKEYGPICEDTATKGGSFLSFCKNGDLQKGRKLRAMVVCYSDGAVVTDCNMDVLYWEK